MKTTHSFGIDFLFRRCKDDKTQALIYARITVDEDRKELSLKERINAVDWDPAKEIVKGKTEQIKSLNKNIEDVRFHRLPTFVRDQRSWGLCICQQNATALFPKNIANLR